MADPKEELQKLQEKLGKKLTDSDNAAAEAKILRAEIEALQRQLSELDRLTQGIAAKKDAFGKDKVSETVSAALKSTTAALEAVSTGKPKKIDDLITAFDKETDKQQVNVDTLKGTLDSKTKAAKDAEAVLAETKKVFEDSFKAPDELGKNIDQIKALKGKMNKAESDSRLDSAYVYVKEANALLAQIAFPDANALSTEISKYRLAWSTAAEALDAAKKAASDAQSQLDTASKALAARKTGRLDSILDGAAKA